MNVQPHPPAINGGVIIIGSLFWEDETNCVEGQESKGLLRRNWRTNNLDTSRRTKIKLPVRYGRYSSRENRRNTYTMILSQAYNTPESSGTGLIVPFASTISNFDDFKRQADELARAEVIYSEPATVSHVCSWGAIAIWVNPTSVLNNEVSQWWNQMIADRTLGYTKNVNDFTWSDGHLLTNNYHLNLPQIDTTLDFLLCTYIRPKHSLEANNRAGRFIYPSAEEVAAAMRASGYQTYFRENRESGICTSDDDEIITSLSSE